MADASAPANGDQPPVSLTAAVFNKGYLMLLVYTAVLGIPISIVSLIFISTINATSNYLWYTLPQNWGLATPPSWMLLLVPVVAGLAIVLIRKLPGDGGHNPIDEFGGSPTRAIDLPSVMLAGFVTLSAGLVLGPEQPLLAVGMGLAALASKPLLKKGGELASGVLRVGGSAAALSAILGNPIVAVVFLTEVMGVGAPMMTLMIIPALLSAGIGYLVFTGLGDYVGMDAPVLSLTAMPAGGDLNAANIGWGIVVAVAAAALVLLFRFLASQIQRLDSHVSRWAMIPVAGVLVGGCAIGYSAITGGDPRDILFDGQSALESLAADSAALAVGGLVVLMIAKLIAFALSAGGGFKGGPVFPTLFLGGVVGILLSDLLPGLDPLTGFMAGMAAATATTLGLPLMSLLLVALIGGTAGFSVLPVVVIATVVGVLIRSWSDGWSERPKNLVRSS